MQVAFNQAERTAVRILFERILKIPVIPRKEKRELTRIMKKFGETSQTVFLKPIDRHRLLTILFRIKEVLDKNKSNEFRLALEGIFEKLKVE